ncbi:hypothetical protein B0H11DRAFT_2323047 [Mycena galericulata]|nr:hypothetical protein B0H11DRAFT_2283608 [Mycena galericulata]KAJ7506687.1 hypothetical protein B0H11DRAFT_2323047 [Mycena galericulata]
MSAPARGRGRGRGRGGSKAKPKRNAPVDSDYDEGTPAKKARTTTEKPALEPREPSSRPNKGVNPARVAPEKKRTNRSHEEVQAGKDKLIADALAAAEARERKRADAVAQIAALDAETDEAAAQEERDAILSVNDLPESMDVDDDTVLSFSDSDFQRIEDEDAYLSQGEFEEPIKKAKSKAVPSKRPQKAKKGETRAEIEALAKTLGDEKKKKKKAVAPKGSLQNRDAAAVSKKAGLSKAYLEASEKAQDNVVSPEKPEIGGLDDEDANSTRPEFSRANTKPSLRVNELVAIEDTSEEEDTPTKAPPAARPVPKPRATRAAPRVKAEFKIPALSIPPSKTPKNANRVKSESSSSVAFTPEVADDVKGLPALVGGTWDSRFLPAAYDALYRSWEPMTFAAKGETAASEKVAVNAIQDILDEVHPGNTLKLVWGDQICKRVINRIRERRSLIGQTALENVNAFFRTKHFLEQPGVIRKYARYAVRPDGPGFFKEPTPENCPPNPRAEGYIKPTGYLESPLMIQTVSVFLKNNEYHLPKQKADGTYDFSGLPAGLFGIAAAGVERALTAYTVNGICGTVPKFTRAAAGTAILAYMSNIDRFTVSRWESLLTAAGNAPTSSDVAETSEAVLDGLREYAYVASSPPA